MLGVHMQKQFLLIKELIKKYETPNLKVHSFLKVGVCYIITFNLLFFVVKNHSNDHSIILYNTGK